MSRNSTTPDVATLLSIASESCQSLFLKATRGESLTSDEIAYLERLSQSASNTIEPLCFGLEGLGDVITQASITDDGIQKETAFSLGWLIMNLASVIHESWRTMDNAEHALRQAEKQCSRRL